MRAGLSPLRPRLVFSPVATASPRMTTQAGPTSQESYTSTPSSSQESPILKSDPPLYPSLFVELRKTDTTDYCKGHLLSLWKQLAQVQSEGNAPSIDGAIPATNYASIPDTTEILMEVYEIEEPELCQGLVAEDRASVIGRKMVAEVKDVGAHVISLLFCS